jgi:hypothetical protein
MGKLITTTRTSKLTIIRGFKGITGSIGIGENGDMKSGHRGNSIRSAGGSDLSRTMNRIPDMNKSKRLTRRAAMTEGTTEIGTKIGTEVGSDELER